MNLIDILNQILNTKNQIKEIVKEIDYSDDFSRYSITIHNFIAQYYNSGYIDGYSDTFDAETGERLLPQTLPLEILEYDSSVSSNYVPYTSDGLTDIMRDVLVSRLDIKDELSTNSDYFPSYPEYLTTLKNTLYSSGYNDGTDAAEDDITPSSAPATPTATYSDNVFTLTPSDTDTVSLYYKIGTYGVRIRYTEPVIISETVTIYSWAQKGNQKSGINETECVYSSSGTAPESTVEIPTINLDGNKIKINSNSAGSTIIYSINDSEEDIYSSIIELTEDGTYTVSAYAVKDNVVSEVNTQNFNYTTPTSSTPLPKCENVTLTQSTDNTITLSTSTTDASIYYRFDTASEYTLYSAPFTLTLQSTILYTKAVKADYEDSDIIYYPLTLIQSYSAPENVMVYDPVDGTVQLSTSTSGAHIWYRLGNVGDFIEVEGSWVRLYLDYDTVLYAYASKNDIDSDMTVYEYTYYSDTFSLPAPSIEFINNRIVITSQYSVLYTLDGRDPRVYGATYVNTVNGFSGISIASTTTIRAIASSFDENYHSLYSDEVTATFTPVEEGEEGYVYDNEYLNITGASEIHLVGTSNSSYNLSYSTDKVEWTGFNKDLTGLDRGTKYYLKVYGVDGYKLFDSFSFGVGDSVTVAGNVLSIIRRGDFSVYTTPSREMSLQKLFENCTALIDASALVIPYSSLLRKDCYRMFAGCSNLISAPANLYFSSVSEEGCREMFEGCTSLISAPRFNITSVDNKGCYRMFADCPNLSSVSMFDLSNSGESSFEECFRNCSALISVSLYIDGTVSKSAFKKTFYNCSSLNTRNWINNSLYIDSVEIKANELSEDCFYHTFENCVSLTGFGTLPAQSAVASCYEGMFMGCSSLVSFGEIGLVNVDTRCCYSMFEGCVSLISAPELRTKYLTASGCYGRMFYDCGRLNYINAAFITNPNRGIYTGSWVSGVAESGTFVQASDATWYEESVDAIPIGWTVPATEESVGRILGFNVEYDRVSIIASNNNTIYYQINSTSEDGWNIYTGAFEVDEDCYVYARCLSNTGVFGDITRSNLLTISVPSLVISSQDNIVSITKPSGFGNFEYSYIYYALYSYGQHNPIQDWTLYTGPFSIDTSYYITAYGVKGNGSDGPESGAEILFGVSVPEIVCENNIVTITCSTPGIDNILYKINDPGDSESGWSSYTGPFVITENCIVTAKARIKDPVQVRYYYSEVIDKSCVYSDGGASYVLAAPEIRRYGNTNTFYVLYNNIGYTLWNNSEIGIVYRVNGGDWSNYIHSEAFDTNITVEAYAVDSNNNTSITKTFSLEYEPSYDYITVTAPEISITKDDYGYVAVYITATMTGATNYYKIDNGEWVSVRNGFYISTPAHEISHCTVYAMSAVGGYWSDISSKEYTKDETPVSEIPPMPTIYYNPATSTVTITSSVTGASIYFSFNNVYFSTYSAPFTINDTVTVYAYITYNGNSSSVASRRCSVEVNIPTISCSFNIVTITKASAYDTIHYSLDGGGTYSTYSEPFSISADVTVYAYSTRGSKSSSVVSKECEYTDSYSSMPLTFECVDGTDGVTIKWLKTGVWSESDHKNFEYNVNNTGWKNVSNEKWEDAPGSSYTWSSDLYLNPGDIVQFRGNNTRYGSSSQYAYADTYFGFKSSGGGRLRIYGNILSMINKTNYRNITTLNDTYNSNAFGNLFSNLKYNLIDASNLVLQATELSQYCYHNLFVNCSYLLTPPTLPATTLAPSCYEAMFMDCIRLQSVPALPATTLAESCYDSMFAGCYYITSSPDLLASYLPLYCYRMMFKECVRLTSIKCLATSWVDTRCTDRWVEDVASEGLFIKDSSSTIWSSGTSGIPVGWTVEDAS